MQRKLLKLILILIIAISCAGNNKIENNKIKIKHGKIYKNIYIENINMEDTTQKEALDILKKAYPLEDLTLNYESKTWTITPKDINLNYKIKESVEKALEYTKTTKNSENIKRKIKLLSGKRHYIDLEVTYDKQKLKNIITTISSEINKEPINATLGINDDGSFKKLPSSIGKKVESQKLQKQIESLLEEKSIMPIKIPVKIIQPTLKTKDIQNINCILGQFSTSFKNNTSREENIHIAEESSGNIIIMPQEIYSYNKTTNPRVLGKLLNMGSPQNKVCDSPFCFNEKKTNFKSAPFLVSYKYDTKQ